MKTTDSRISRITLGGLWSRGVLRQGVGDVEPGGFRADEEMQRRLHAWIIVEHAERE